MRRGRIGALVVLGAAALGAGLWLLTHRSAVGPAGEASRAEPAAPAAPAAAELAGAPAKGAAPAKDRTPTAPPPAGPEAAPQAAPTGAAKEGALSVLVTWKGRAKAGATVRVRRLGEDSTFSATTTDETGLARLASVDLNRVALEAYAPGTRVQTWVATWRRSDAYRDREGIVHLSLEPGVPFDGRVLDASTGLALAGASVQVHDWSEEFEFGPTDAEGRFHVPGVMDDHVARVTARAPGHALATLDVHVDGGKPQPAEAVLRLERSGRIVGTVVSADGTPVADAVVEFAPAATGAIPLEPLPTPVPEDEGNDVSRFEFDDDILQATGPAAERTRTAADGSFRADGIRFGVAYALRAQATGHATSPSLRDLTLPPEAPERSVTVRLRRAVTVIVRIVGPPPKEVASTRVRILGDRLWMPAPQYDGTFRFADLDPGAFDLFAQAPGYLTGAKRLVLTEGETREVDLRLEEGASVEGVVVDEEGRPLAEAEVQVAEAKRNHDETAGRFLLGERKATTDTKGRFVVRGVPPGPAVLVAEWWAPEGRRHLATRGRVSVVSPARDLRVTLKALNTLRVRLVTPEGKPFSGTLWTMLRRESGGGGGSEEIEDGVEEEGGLDDGDYTWTLRPEGYAWIRREVTLHDGATVDLGDLVLDRGVDVTGRVLDGRGKPIASAKVTCVEVDDRSTVTDGQGRFALDRFPHEPFTLQATADGFSPATIQVDPAHAADLEVRLCRPATLRGVLKNAKGEIVAKKGLEFRSAQAKPRKEKVVGPDGAAEEATFYEGSEWAATGDDGRYSVVLGCGAWLVIVSGPDGKDRQVAEVTLSDGEVRDLTIVLPPP